jgi:hypothetical protein
LNETLIENKNIEKIDLKLNRITSKGIYYLKESLKQNQNIKEIKFSCKKSNLKKGIK